MKKILFLLLAGTAGLIWAQTNTPPPAKAPAVTTINSDSADFDMNAHRMEYLGHVVLIDPQISLLCDRLVVELPKEGQRPNRISAESVVTNVVIDLTQNGKTYHVTCTNAVYTYSVENSKTNELVTLTGDPVVQNGENIMRSDKIVWDRGTGHFQVYNHRGEFMTNPDGKSGTNGLPLKLF
ncbi:MAG: LptA/OstA family protein [Verrucomicrobiae bacterium]|nr:LptA/OstA family protein [Verrucomicrobiae bacterium]